MILASLLLLVISLPLTVVTVDSTFFGLMTGLVSATLFFSAAVFHQDRRHSMLQRLEFLRFRLKE